jgi:Ca2+-transporting ATPase
MSQAGVKQETERAAPWTVEPTELQRQWQTSAQGLTAEQVASRREEFGRNALESAPPEPMWRRLAGQFKDLVIWILIAAAVIAGAMGEWVDTVAILAIVVLNGVIGFLQEERAQRALAALAQLSSPTARVIRGGRLESLPAEELVPGDFVEIEAGDYVPADGRLVEAFALRVMEAALTGESVPTEKEAGEVLAAETPLGDRANMMFMGTVVANGKGSLVVTATGMQTELGKIAGLLKRQEPETTPLQRRLAELGKILLAVCLTIVAVIFSLQMWRGGDLAEVFLLSVSLAVAAVPEGLPAVVTLALALGLQRMVKRRALVRKLPSVETLGSVTIVCSDKTGTLTRNEMTVRAIASGDSLYRVTGAGYQPEGRIERREGNSDSFSAVDAKASPDLQKTLEIARRCNHATVRAKEGRPEEFEVIGDPTEGALLVAAMKGSLPEIDAQDRLVRELPFDSQRKAMSVVIRHGSGDEVLYAKGAPEVILERSTHVLREGQAVALDEARKKEILATGAGMAEQALRVLALAYRPDPPDVEDAERELIFAGLVGMIDPPREEVKQAVATCHEAGIRPVMITGDHPATARAIALELGIAQEQDRVLTGHDLDQLDEQQLNERVAEIAVYARVSAEHKLQIVQAWKQRGQVVAMTGDGVNDAPAVKAADIGIAMGVTGTDVTKEASDMVLMDDNFTTIVSAVEEGRGIFDNIQKFVHYLLSCNASEVLLMFWAALVGWPSPLLPIQLLWINLVTDGLPALALGMEPPEKDVMQRPPRPPREPVITWSRGSLIVVHGLLMAAAAGTGFWWALGETEDSLEEARTVSFLIVAFSQLLFSLSCRSHTRTLPELGFFTNPYLIGAIAGSALLQVGVIAMPFTRGVFEVVPLDQQQWIAVVVLALTPVTIVECVKLVRALFQREASQPHGPLAAGAMR